MAYDASAPLGMPNMEQVGTLAGVVALGTDERNGTALNNVHGFSSAAHTRGR